MPALIIIGVVMLIFIGILALKATLKIEYRDEVMLSVKVLYFEIGILPKKKPKPLDPSKMTPKKYRRLLERERKKEQRRALKKKQRAEKKQKKAQNEKRKSVQELAQAHKQPKKRSLLENISLIKEILAVVLGRFSRHLRIKLTRIRLVIGTDDAAKTAMIYGAAAAGVACITEMLDNVTNIEYTTDADVSVDADFLSERIDVDVKIEISLRVWHLLDIALRAIGTFVKNK